jgi:hypothetical protein
MNDRTENPYSAPKAPPNRKARGTFRVFLSAVWAGFFATVLTFALLTGVEVVLLLIVPPDYLPPFKVVPPHAELIAVVVNVVVSMPMGAYAAARKLGG